jgi:hypothetical protein
VNERHQLLAHLLLLAGLGLRDRRKRARQQHDAK